MKTHQIPKIAPIILVLMIVLAPRLDAQNKKKDGAESKNDSLKSSTFSGLKWRSIGPAFTSGRIADFAVNPENTKEYYVAVASGHVWKTTNAGTTWKPVFDNYGAYSIGVVTMDPNNHHVVWVGTGENNHQRCLGYGNGVWKSVDGGETFKNMGLKESRQTGGIVIDPRNSDIVFVAAEGSAWGPGGDRGLYKTTDGGVNWKKVLEISENTGVNNVIMDPFHPDIMYATSEQRRRHTFTKIGGGPESTIYKSTDGGENWKKINKGLPEVDMGGIGIDISPVNPDVVYAIIEARDDKSGFYRSDNRGESWSRMSDHSASGQYYNEIYCDPVDVDRVYSVETWTQVTNDGGKTWEKVSTEMRHVDDHAMWIDPADNEHFLIGGDGGIYESRDQGKTFHFKSNLPVTQFYRVEVDNEYPFYNVYGGTQDNNTLGGPSQNTSSFGVTNEEWKAILGGDGYWVAVDPKNPDIIYCEYQYGNSYRYDRKSGERLYIKPQPGEGEKTYKWNWDTPLILSPHSNTRIYTAANKVFRSDDRGDTWQVISDDITAQIDRNTWPVMDHYWSYDAVVKDVSTSLFGMAVSLVESTVKEDLLYVGTDDGVISVTDNAGADWRQVKSFPGIPANTYVSDILPDKFDENVVYACFNNHKRDDFKPYVMKSTDKGKSWTSISNNLPENGPVHTLEQDFVNPNLIFAGTEFAAFFSIDGGKEWVKLGSGLPDVNVRDWTLHEGENDLAIATFGRGFYILDDYTPLRLFKKEMLEKNAHIFPVADALMYIQDEGKYGQGSTFFAAKNPEFGAAITYYLKEEPKTLKEQRHEKEKELFKEKKPIPQPSVEDLRAEENEIPPYLQFTIYDADGNEVRKIFQKPAEGINRITWNLKYNSPYPVSTEIKKFDPFAKQRDYMLAMPGKYSVDLSIVAGGEAKKLADPVAFTAKTLDNTTLPAASRKELVDFQVSVAKLAHTMQATEYYLAEQSEKVKLIRQTILQTPGSTSEMMAKSTELEIKIKDIQFLFDGQEARASSEEIPPADVPLNQRLSFIITAHWESTSAVTNTQKESYRILSTEVPIVLDKLKFLSEELKMLENQLEKIHAPWTPGRIPAWQKSN